MGIHWIPGFLTVSAIHLRQPDLVSGIASGYGPGVMEAVAEKTHRSYAGYAGAVAMEFCNDVGSTVWIKRGALGWDGPFLVIDCARPVGLYANIVDYGVVVEVDYKTVQRWGRLGEVWVSKNTPREGVPVNLAMWFLAQDLFGDR